MTARRSVGRDRATIRLWLRGVEQHGQEAFLDKSAEACKVPRPSRPVAAPGGCARWLLQVIQMDSVDFGGVFAFTAVDIFSREAEVFLRAELSADNGAAFLHRCMSIAA